MKSSHLLPTSILATAVALGMSANVALAAPQPAQDAPHSSNTGQAVSDAWITTKVKSELATTKGVTQQSARKGTLRVKSA